MVKLTDATLGARPPEGAVVLFNGKNLDGWVKLDGKTAADWPVNDGIFTVGKGNILTRKAVRQLSAPSRIQRSLHAEGSVDRGEATAGSS